MAITPVEASGALSPLGTVAPARDAGGVLCRSSFKTEHHILTSSF